MANFFYRHVDDCLVAVSGTGDLSDEDFRHFVDAIDRPEVTRYLSYSTGDTKVSSHQRKQTAEILRKRKIRTALVNESKTTKGFVAAGRLLGLVDMRVFSRARTDEALAYLNVPRGDAVRAALDECCREFEARS